MYSAIQTHLCDVLVLSRTIISFPNGLCTGIIKVIWFPIMIIGLTLTP